MKDKQLYTVAGKEPIMKNLRKAFAAVMAVTAVTTTVSVKAEASNNSTMLNNGMAGMFEYYGSTAALSYLKGSLSSYTNIGKTGDATSLDNMDKAMTYLEKANEIRRSNGLSEFRVTDELMAIAAAQVNWSSQNIAHSEAYNVGENLAWGTDPFRSWYTEELFAKNNASLSDSEYVKKFQSQYGYNPTSGGVVDRQTGHLENLLDSSYVYTGFAVSNDSETKYKAAYSQTFEYSRTTYSKTNSYTVSEYKARIAAFKNAMNTTNTTTTTVKSTSTSTVEIYRMYNPNSGENHYCDTAGERDALIGYGWIYKGIAWIAPSTSGTPVYRMYNKYAGEHHYTMDLGEVRGLEELGWTAEGVAFYSDDSKSYPVYREYNPNLYKHNHYYTSSLSENNSLVAQGWVEENGGWYAVRPN